MEFKAKDIAAFLDGEVIGDEEIKVTGVSKIEDGKEGTLAFLANPKYEGYLYSSDASVILINKQFELKKEVSATLIKVDDAYQAFAALLDLYLQAKAGLKTGVEQPSYVNESAVVKEGVYIGAFAYIGKNAKIGENAKIYPQVYVGDNVVVGDNTVLYAGSKIYDDCIIGNGCIIHSGAVIGADGFGFAPQDNGEYKKIAQIGNVVLEDDVEIGANTTVDCGTMGSTIIRKGVKLDNLIQVAHNCEIGKNTVIAALAGLAGTTKIGQNCQIGGQVGFAGHLAVGNNVKIGPQSGISKNIKDGRVVLGAPAVDLKEAIKINIVFRNLPALRDDVIQLQKDIKEIKQTEKD
ncbi:UDP-3-O-[3-hydroxymyristoyl] glucosamine N-acyltransferase [hydrothermal vent metagenome]|uniref:UDP-3-O-[3-hydroxymyristoyl] glucosamine N-acyltransferase n=1 Tax=hydrothermal vent metagenome TaxID=652676 RepID=A0A3B0TX06_9ZZZZ